MKIAIFDFDGTLTPYPITVLGILEKCGFIGGGNNLDFINLVKNNMKKDNISVYVSFYHTIFDVIISNGYLLKDDILSIGSCDIEYNKGVYDFLEYLYKNNVINYIISSGVKPFLDKTIISKFFNEIYATSFKYNKSDEIINIDNLITDNKKVEVIKDIIKRMNMNDCSNIIYFGDGLTDLPVMDFIKNNGGTTIFVYDNEDELNKSDFVSYYLKKDFSLDGEIFKIVKDVFDI